MGHSTCTSRRGVQPEAARQAVGNHVDDEVGDQVRVVLGEQKEVGEAVADGQLPGVDAVGIGDHAASLRLPEHVGQPHAGQALGGEQVAEYFSCADAGELVDVADNQQVSAGWDRLDQFVGQQHIQHRGLVDHHQVGVQRMVAVKGGVPAGSQL